MGNMKPRTANCNKQKRTWSRSATLYALLLAVLVFIGYTPAALAQTCTPLAPVQNPGFEPQSGSGSSAIFTSWTKTVVPGSSDPTPNDGWTQDPSIPVGAYMGDDFASGSAGTNVYATLHQDITNVSPRSMFEFELLWNNGGHGAGLRNGSQVDFVISYAGVPYVRFVTSPDVGSGQSGNGPTGGATFTALNGATLTQVSGGWTTTFSGSRFGGTYRLTLPAGVPESGLLRFGASRTEALSLAADNLWLTFLRLYTPSVCLRKSTLLQTGTPTFGFSATNSDTNTATTATDTTASITTPAAGTPVPHDSNSATAGSQPFRMLDPGSATTISESALTSYELTGISCTGVTGTPTVNLATRTVTLPANSVTADTMAVCTFTNGQTQARFAKATLPANINQDFTLNAGNGVGAVTINAATGNSTYRALTDRTTDTTIIETGVPGWRGAGISCVANTANNGETLGRVAYSDPSFNYGRSLDYTRTIPGGSFISGNAYTCTITNNAALIRYAKTTLPNGVDQNFIINTNAGAPATTINATTGVSAYNLLTEPTFTRTFTETGVAGWRGRSMVCVAETANYGETVGNVGYSNTIPGTAGADFTSSVPFVENRADSSNAIVNGNAYTCTFTNDRTRIRLDKATSPVADWNQNFVVNSSASNGIASTTINASGTASTYQAVTNIAANTVLTEGAVPSWRGYGVNCVADTAVGGETSGNARFTSTAVGTVSSSYQVTIPANTLVGGNDYTCTITNQTTVIRIAKVTQGDTGTFVFNGSAANGNGVPTDDSYTVTTATPGTAVSGPSVILTNAGTLTEVIETQVTGWTLTSARCEDLNAAESGNPVGQQIGSVTDGSTLVIPAQNVRQGAELLCTFTNSFTGFSLTGRVLIDNGLGGGTAHNAIADGTEAGLAGVPVLLTDCGGTVYAQASTAGDGSYDLTLTGPSVNDTVCVRRDVASSFVGVSGSPGDTGGSISIPGYDSLTFTFAESTDYTGVVFGVIERPTLELDQSATGAPGAVVQLNHQYTATTTANVSFSLADQTGAPNTSSFASTPYRDQDCSGTLEPSETAAVLSSVNVVAGDEICIVVRTQISSGAPDGASYDYDLEADTTLPSTSASVISLSNGDRIIVSADGTITLIKRVRNVSTSGPAGIDSTASPGDVLEYTITFENPSSAPVSNISVFDEVPAHSSLAAPPGATVVDIPAGMSCQVVVPAAGSSGYVGPIQWDCTGSLSPGDAGQVAFQVRIDE